MLSRSFYCQFRRHLPFLQIKMLDSCIHAHALDVIRLVPWDSQHWWCRIWRLIRSAHDRLAHVLRVCCCQARRCFVRELVARICPIVIHHRRMTHERLQIHQGDNVLLEILLIPVGMGPFNFSVLAKRYYRKDRFHQARHWHLSSTLSWQS